jgi:RNA methyltransferase, TrmH family
MITSRKNPKVQQIRVLLAQKNQRQQTRQCVLEGVRLLEEAVQATWQPEFGFYTQNLSPRAQELIQQFNKKQIILEEVPPDLFTYLADTENPQGIIAVFNIQPLPVPSAPTYVLILDAIRDPGNLGTILRTAAAAGVDLVLLSSDCVDPFSPKVLRAGMGAHFRLPIEKQSVEETILYCQQMKLTLFIADSNASTSCWEKNFRQALALVIGNEANGPAPEYMTPPSQPINIPMPGKFESLNAAMAAGILLFEIVRQRQK